MRGCLLLLLAACRSDDEVEGRARALLEAARRAKAPEAPAGPVSLTVENLGVLRVDPGVDPADVVDEAGLGHQRDEAYGATTTSTRWNSLRSEYPVVAIDLRSAPIRFAVPSATGAGP